VQNMKVKLIRGYITSSGQMHDKEIMIVFRVDTIEFLRKKKDIDHRMYEEIRQVLGLKESERVEIDEWGRYVIVNMEDDEERPLTKGQAKIVREIEKRYREEERKLEEELEKMVRAVAEKMSKIFPDVLEIEV